VTTINQEMCIGVSRESAKQLPWRAECRCGMLFEIQGMLKLGEWLNSLQTCEGGWEKYYETGRTPLWKKYIQVRLFPRTSQLVMVWVARRPSRHFLTLSRHFILLKQHGSLSTVSLLLEDVLLHRHSHHLTQSRLQIQDSIRISWTTATCCFCDGAR